MEKERKQGFFAALKEEVVRGLSPARSRGKSPAPPRSASPARMLIPRRRRRSRRRRRCCSSTSGSSSSRAPVACAPAVRRWRRSSRGPTPSASPPATPTPRTPAAARGSGTGSAATSRAPRPWPPPPPPPLPAPADRRAPRSGAPTSASSSASWAPRSPPSRPSSPSRFPSSPLREPPLYESSSAQYILHQYTAASGGYKLLRSVRNAYAMGKVRMVASEFETATRVVKNRGPTGRGAAAVEQGGFVLWQMAPDMWYVELAVGGSKVHAGSNGRLVWRHTPWLGAHAAKGPVRPLRRVLQGLDPLTTAGLFAEARCVGEKKVNGEDCFILKLTADPQTLKLRSEGPAEIIRHVLFGYFSQRTGLIVQIEDSHLTRIQPHAGGDAVYWETTISSALEDYRAVEGIMIAHSGQSAVTLFGFGEAAMSHTKTRMEEAWSIEEVAFNVPGLSVDCFIPPADIRSGSVGEACELPPSQSHGERARAGAAVHPSRVVAVERAHASHHHSANAGAGGRGEKIVWRVEV
ncbi:unnamed protein product [Urochloa decumbens]|uniref:Uncharacterized protein n=1 Tax=Urochloa decumbens TaxID=240449 RepID=A0ABC9G0I9_9POAL